MRSREMLYPSTFVQFVHWQIPANENQNFFVRTIAVVPRIHPCPFSLLGYWVFLLRQWLLHILFFLLILRVSLARIFTLIP